MWNELMWKCAASWLAFLLLTPNGRPDGEEIVPDSSEDSLLQALSRAVRCFQRIHAPYVLIGGWAVAVWGRPRATMDLDFLVMVNEKNLNSLLAEMVRAGIAADDGWSKHNPMLRPFQVRLQFREVTLDILRPRDRHDRELFRRRRKKRLEGRYYWIVAPEDFILQKLKVGRPRDFEDAISVLERSRGELNRRYLERWAKRLGIIGELSYITSL